MNIDQALQLLDQTISNVPMVRVDNQRHQRAIQILANFIVATREEAAKRAEAAKIKEDEQKPKEHPTEKEIAEDLAQV